MYLRGPVTNETGQSSPFVVEDQQSSPDKLRTARMQRRLCRTGKGRRQWRRR